jgi:hypothetical protein
MASCNDWLAGCLNVSTDPRGLSSHRSFLTDWILRPQLQLLLYQVRYPKLFILGWKKSHWSFRQRLRHSPREEVSAEVYHGDRQVMARHLRSFLFTPKSFCTGSLYIAIFHPLYPSKMKCDPLPLAATPNISFFCRWSVDFERLRRKSVHLISTG